MKKLYVLLGVITFLISVIAMAPARTIYGWASPRLPEQVRLYEIEGTLFHGHAGMARVDNVDVHDVTWDVHPLSLLSAALSLDVRGRMAGGQTSATARISPGGAVRLENVVSTATISGFKPVLDTGFLPATGQIGLRLQSAEIKNGKILSAQGKLTVGRLAWTLTEPAVALGDYRADISTGKSGITATLQNADAPVELTGRCLLTPKDLWRAHIQLRARPDAQSDVKNLLRNIGNKDSQGWYTIDQSGRFSSPR